MAVEHASPIPLTSDQSAGNEVVRADSVAEPAGEMREGGPGPVPEMEASKRRPARRARKSLMDRVEAFIARLSARSHFWNRVCSLIWLPYAFRSGIRMRKEDDRTFSAELPFRRFNRNWYNAMAGAALLGNSEIAGGMYIFGICSGDYTIVCKSLEYRFLRPCYGPARYRITPREDIHALIATGEEFNITLDLDVVQAASIPTRGKEKRVGRCTATFHVTPQLHHKAKRGHVRNVGNAERR